MSKYTTDLHLYIRPDQARDIQTILEEQYLIREDEKKANRKKSELIRGFIDEGIHKYFRKALKKQREL